MNRQVHFVIGVVLFLIFCWLAGFFYRVTPGLFVPGIIAVAFGSLLPDILEPATSARHRGIFHSRRVLGFVAVLFLLAGILVITGAGTPRLVLMFSAACFFLGYSAHLVADSVTRAGLPG